MAKPKDVNTNLASLLPEGLDESTIDKIAKLLDSKIKEEVQRVTEEQTRKTVSFIRGNIDRLKEHAIKELELENETFRNAKMFETVRSMFAVELTGDDELNAITALASMSEQQEQKSEVLIKEIDRLLSENVKLKNTAKILYDRNNQLDEKLTSLSEQVETLQETNDAGGKIMSDSAIVVSSKNFERKASEENSVTDKIVESDNEWLQTTAVMDALKSLNNGSN